MNLRLDHWDIAPNQLFIY